MNSFIFRLPQTIIRAYGFKNLLSLNFFQAPINNPGLSKKIVESIIEMNNDLLSSISSDAVDISNFSDKSYELISTALIESNLIHGSHLLFKHIPVKYLVPYASGVFNPKYTDLRDPRAFLKCLRDSWQYKKLVSPEGVLDWASMILNENKDSYFPWFWDRIELDFSIYQERINLAEIFLGKKSELINKIRTEENPIIIQPTRSINNTTYNDVIDYYYTKSLEFRQLVDSGNISIFIKPHRSEVLHEKIQPTYRYRGNKVFTPNNLYDFYIPTEVLVNTNNDARLVSEVSSSVFNSLTSRNIIIENELTKSLFHQYGLISHRFKSMNYIRG